MKRRSALLRINAKRPKIDFNVLPINLMVRKVLANRILAQCSEKHISVHSLRPLDIQFTKSGNIVTEGLVNTDILTCIAYLVFGNDAPKYATWLKTFLEKYRQSDSSYNSSDLLVKIASCLQTQLIVFTDRQYPPRCINPNWDEQSVNGQTGSILINYDSIVGTYEPVVGYNVEDVVKNKPDENIVLKSIEGIQKSVSLSSLVENASTLFKLKTFNSKTIDTNLDEKSLTRFIGFVKIPASFQPQLEDDVKLYEFSLTWKIHSLSRLIRENVYTSKDVRQLSVFLNGIKLYDIHMKKAYFNLLQKTNLDLLKQLPDMKHDSMQDRIDTLVDFHEDFKDVERLKDSYQVIKIDRANAFVFVDEWKLVPVNECLFDIVKILTNTQKYVLWDDTLVFLKGSELGRIKLFSPYETATFTQLPKLGPDLEHIQICKSNKQLLYLFDPETTFFANIDDSFQVGEWNKLRDKDYRKVRLRDTTLDAFIIRYRNDDNSFEEEILLCQSEQSNIKATISGYIVNMYTVGKHFEHVEKETTYEKNFVINTTSIPADEMSNSKFPIFELEFVEKLNSFFIFVVSDNIPLDRHIISLLNN